MQVELRQKDYKYVSKETYSEDDRVKKIDQSIKHIIDQEGFSEYTVSKKCISTKGGNYIGELYEIDVIGKTDAGDKELHIFVKNMIKNHESVKIVTVSDMYRTELFIYKELFYIFENLQNEAGVPLEERYRMVKAYENSDESVLLLENVSRKGYKTYNRMDLASLKFLKLCFKDIARFHGLSFVLKERQPEYFKKKLKSLKCPLIFGDNLREVIQNVRDITVKHIDEGLKEKVLELFMGLHEKLSGYINDETLKTCLCHGDYRANNILMKEEDGEVQDVIPIDFQAMHYGCPIFDLLYLIYFCTDRDFRKAHLSDLKDVYYNTLRNFLKYFKLDVDTVYPRNEFEKVFREKLDYGLLMALQLLPFLFVSETEAPDIQQWNRSFTVETAMKERIQGIIEEFIELGYV